MKRLGILGGISHESTLAYYQQIHALYYARFCDYYYPEVVVYSLNFQKFTDYEDIGDQENYVAYIMQGIRGLEQAGAEVVVMAANSPHAVFPEVAAQTNVPMLSIVEVTAQAAHRAGARKLLLLGIRFTMQSSFYADVCAQVGIDVVVPSVAEQDEINRIVFAELARGEILEASRVWLVALIEAYAEEYGIDGAILGCTELPLLLGTDDTHVPLYDTMALHVDAALAYLMD